MRLFKRQPKIIVHDGRFHADDIFASATLRLLGEKGQILRSRDEKNITAGDYVMDTGGIYDPSKRRFDHHQIGGAGIRANGIPYAAFGLVWKEYGEKICGGSEAAARVEKVLVLPIDAADNGVTTFDPIPGKPFPYLVQSAFSAFMPTWKESSEVTDAHFVKLVGIAEEILAREVTHAKDFVEAEKELERIYRSTEDKRMLVLDRMYPWEEILVRYPEPLLIVASRSLRVWKVEGALVAPGSFDRRLYMPEAWAGLRDGELAKASGVSDAVFCHNGRFIAVAKSKEGALALAKLALDAHRI